MNCLYWANIGAGATIGANFRINLIDIALRYCFNWALINTGAASGAVVVNYVSHRKIILVKLHS
jgi:hypothetical protein